MTWRYQPVTVKLNNETLYRLCEVYLDEDGSLYRWTSTDFVAPMGETLGELMQDITYMKSALEMYDPVDYDKFFVGMVFKKKC